MHRAEGFRIFLVFIAILAITYYFARLDPDWHHDGIMFKPAVDVAAGLILFKETFTQYGALTTYLQAGAISLFGEHLIVLRLQATLFLSLAGVLFYLVVSRATSSLVALLSTGIWVLMAPYMVSVFLPWSSIYALFFCLLAALLITLDIVILSQHRFRSLLPFFAGLFFSAAFWARQPYGVVFPVVLLHLGVLGLCKDHKMSDLFRSGVSLSSGFITGLLLMLFWLWSEGALRDWWLQSILGAQTFAESTNTTSGVVIHLVESLFPDPKRVLAASGSWVWTILPALNLAILVFLALFAAFRKCLSDQQKVLLVLALLGVGTWHQYYPVLSVAHTFFGATPMFATVIVAAFLSVKKVSPHVYRLPLIAGFLALLFGYDVLYRVESGIKIYPKFQIEFPTLEGMRFSNQFVERSIRYPGTEAQYFANLGQFGQFLAKLRTLDRDITLLSITEDAFLPTLFPSNNPHKITVWWHWAHKMYPDHRNRVREFIAIQRPLIEIKTKRWGWESVPWVDPESPQRADLGFSDYEPIFETDYSDSGISQILAPPEFIARFKADVEHN
jgi:hypothetical protein